MKKWIVGLLVLVGLAISAPVAVAQTGFEAYVGMSDRGWNSVSAESSWWCDPDSTTWWADICQAAWSDNHNHWCYLGNYSGSAFEGDAPKRVHDIRDPVHGSDGVDHIFLLFKTIGSAWSVNSNPWNETTAGIYAAARYFGSETWYVVTADPPVGSYWSVWVLHYNQYRPDEMVLQLIEACTDSSIPAPYNPAQWSAYGQ